MPNNTIIYNKTENQEWKRPWDIEKFDNIYHKDERFFAILMKGLLIFLNREVIMKGKSIPHYILTTGSEYLYVEKNEYEYSLNTTSGETTLYSKVPRCVIELGGISIPKEELTSPYSRGHYERVENGQIVSYNAEIRRIPIAWQIHLKYQLNDMNESIILLEEIIAKFIWQKYFRINYLGNLIDCSIEFPDNFNIEFNKVDFDSVDNKNKTIPFDLVLKSSYPQINNRTEADSSKVISGGTDFTTDPNDPESKNNGGFIVNVNPHTYQNDHFQKHILDKDNTYRKYDK